MWTMRKMQNSPITVICEYAILHCVKWKWRNYKECCWHTSTNFLQLLLLVVVFFLYHQLVTFMLLSFGLPLCMLFAVIIYLFFSINYFFSNFSQYFFVFLLLLLGLCMYVWIFICFYMYLLYYHLLITFIHLHQIQFQFQCILNTCVLIKHIFTYIFFCSSTAAV